MNGLPEVTLSEIDGVRYLHLGTPWVQGAMRISRPQRIELDYVQRMLAGLLWRRPDELGEGEALQLGLGAGSLTRFTLQTLGLPTTVVEINPQVVAACHAAFRLPRDHAQLRIVQADAGQWVDSREALARAGCFSLLHIDLYDHEAAAPVLDSPGFYSACRRLLQPEGVMAVNLFGRHARFARSAGHLVEAFGEHQVWRLTATREGNTILLASPQAPMPDREALKSRASALEQRFIKQGLGATQWPRMVRPLSQPG